MLRMLKSNVLVEREEVPDITPGGLVIPNQAKEKPLRGTVVAVGPGEWTQGAFIEVMVEVGAKVYFGGFSGIEVTHDGKTYLMMPESELLAVIEKAGGKAK